MRRPDVARIRDLRADDVAIRLGLLDPDGPAGGRSTRWRFRGYDGSHWVELHAGDGKWTDHKHSEGGDAISLVQAAIDGAPNFAVLECNFIAACEMIAEAYGLWETIAEERRRSHRLAESEATMQQLVAEAEARRLDSPNWQECLRLLEALSVERYTLCPDIAGTGALCWQPAVPWQGVPVSYKEQGRYGGWTAARAREHLGDPDALQLIALDFDGSKPTEKTPALKPSVALLDRLIIALGKRGLAPAAVVWSSVDEAEERTKAHMYWRALRKATDEAEWKAWWGLLADACAEIVAEWSAVPPAEKAALEHDPATCQITRLMRLPGFAKTGKKSAGVLVRASGAPVDLDAYLQTRDVVVAGGGVGTVTLGKWCVRAYEKKIDGEMVEVEQPLGRCIWPVATYEDEAGAHGVRVRYHDRLGRVRYTLVEADAWVTKQRGAAAGARLALDGAQVAVGAEHHLVYALGLWAQHQERPAVRAVRAAGWHEDCRAYLFGAEVLGTGALVAAAHDAKLRCRGTLDAWQRGAEELVVLPGALTALAVSLAGALIKPLGRDNFGLHLYGDSGCGKSSALAIAASVWGDGYETFNQTVRALEQRSLSYSGACYVLDELGQAQAKGDDLGQLAYNLVNGQERGRLTRTAEQREQGSWSCTILSSGEHSLEETIGDATLGGHLVRWVDLHLDRGDSTTDAVHVDLIKSLCQRQYGTLGRAWVQHLIGLDFGEVDRRYIQLKAEFRRCATDKRRGLSAEVGRIMDHLAVAGLALELAYQAGLLPWLTPEAWSAWGAWVIERVKTARAWASCPEERAWSRLLRDVATQPARYPAEDANVEPRELAGVVTQDGGRLWTSRVLLADVCRSAGCSVDALAEWLQREGRWDGKTTRTRHFGRQLRWMVVDISDEEPSEGDQMHL